ncbi:MAG: hypothetical protein GPI99_15400 [Microcystis aeruginosa W13-15]|nr:hypothetical protein [Microcystis aeruginosa W13-15]
MKNIKLTTTLFFVFCFSLIAEPGKYTFESGIKAQKAEFIPYEYSRDISDAEPLIGYSIKKLKNNSKVINPFFIIYKNLEKGFGIEFDYTTIQIPKANYEKQYYFRNNIFVDKEYLRNNERSDYRLNFFFFPSEKFKDYFAIGAGLRRIDRIRNDEKENSTAEEKIIALGPQLVFKSTIPVSDSISFILGIDFYHTQGKRNYYYLNSQLSNARSGSFSTFETITQNGKTLGVFRGFQADIALKYNFLEHFNIAIGYNYNYSYFKYQNLDDTFFYLSTLRNNVYFENSKLSNGKEIIQGFYISASTVF